MADWSVPVVKTLFALSGNSCAYTGCEQRLTDPSWKQVNAHIAHIRGERPGAARFDALMTDTERNGFENLILLCPNHHHVIDALEPDTHTVELLLEMKQRHEARAEPTPWTSDEKLSAFATLAIDLVIDLGVPGGPSAASEAVLRPATVEMSANVLEPTVSAGAAPRLVAEMGSGDAVEVVNFGDADAYGVSVEPLPGTEDAWVPRPGPPPSRLSPGARWSAGLLAGSLADVGPYNLRLKWRDANGRTFDGEFPLG
jgi:hypothetical protein